MKVRITSTRHVMPVGTVLDVGDEALEHECDGKKGGSVWRKPRGE
jgi:hypothetical protein